MATPYVAVIGASNATEWELATAEDLGHALADAGCILVCGGLGGVMNAAARGAEAGGGVSIGILPGDERDVASRHLTVAIATGFGEACNAIVGEAHVVIAVGGEFGTRRRSVEKTAASGASRIPGAGRSGNATLPWSAGPSR
jgi:uncharacterized protein (TIGR00725 family)